MNEENTLQEKLNVDSLDEKTKNIAQEILDTDDVEKVKSLTNLFNVNAQKRNVIRIMKMNSLLDKVTDKVVERFDKTPDNFSNDDLIKYMQVTDNALERATKNLTQVEEAPTITYQQNNQVNINLEAPVNRASRANITEAVQNLLNRLSKENNKYDVEIDNSDSKE